MEKVEPSTSTLDTILPLVLLDAISYKCIPNHEDHDETKPYGETCPDTNSEFAYPTGSSVSELDHFAYQYSEFEHVTINEEKFR